MRLFFALPLSLPVREALSAAEAALRRQGRGSFPPPENLHLTLAFLGETSDLDGARAALAGVSCRPFSLAVGGPLGHFDDLWWGGGRARPPREGRERALRLARRWAWVTCCPSGALEEGLGR